MPDPEWIAQQVTEEMKFKLKQRVSGKLSTWSRIITFPNAVKLEIPLENWDYAEPECITVQVWDDTEPDHPEDIETSTLPPDVVDDLNMAYSKHVVRTLLRGDLAYLIDLNKVPRAHPCKLGECLKNGVNLDLH